MIDRRAAFVQDLQKLLREASPAAVCIVITHEDAIALGQDLANTRRPEDRPWGHKPGLSPVDLGGDEL